MKTRVSVLMLLLFALPAFAMPTHPRKVFMRKVIMRKVSPTPANPLKAAAMKPNFDISTYRRCYTPAEKVQINLSGFNVHAVEFAAYRLDLANAVKASGDLVNFGKTIRAYTLLGHSPVQVWSANMGKVFPDQWSQIAANVPHLPPGTYILDARASGIERRTWIAVTDVALVTKRSRQELLIFAADAVFGRPIPHLALTLEDTRGKFGAGRTGPDGLLRLPTENAQGNLWIDGDSALGPAFALSGEPAAPEPYTVYSLTDRPIYRPGNKVNFKAIIRARQETAGPGGFTYKVYANQPAVVEIRDATDALIESRPVTTNAAGALSGTFQLAAEPTLGSWHINVVVGQFTAYNDFLVEEYRKPEMTATVTIPKTHYLGGTSVPVTIDAQYYFGRPMSGGTVAYTVSCPNAGPDENFSGKGVLDNHGDLHFDVPTKLPASDTNLSVQATITDGSRRSITASASTQITAALFQLSLDMSKDEYLPGERMQATAHAEDYDNHPVAGVKVTFTMIETKEDRQQRQYEERTTRGGVTDAHGDAIAYFSNPRPADLQFEAVAYDSQGDKVSDDANASVVAKIAPVQNVEPTLSLSPNKEQYHPGDVATVDLETTLVRRPFVPATKTTPAQPAHPDAWALVTVEGERLGRQELVHLTEHHTELHIPLTANDFPSVSLNVVIIEDRQIYEQQASLPVVRENQKLHVVVTSDKAVYEPGQTATYTVKTTDYQGHPVPADVSLGVVDASIYAIQPDSAPDMEEFFYSGQEVRVTTDFSFAAQYSGGGYQNMGAMAATPASANGIRVRKTFADTAYWNPDVQTGTDGTAQVTFTVPDNLTTWRATARGITMQTAVGSTTEDAIAVMPLLVRLELPSFTVRGDQTTVSAIVQNGTATPKTVQVKMSAQGATLTGDLTRTVTLGPNEQKRLDWAASVSGPDSAQFLVTADGGSGAQDATESTIPVRQDGLKMVTASAETLSDTAASDKIDLAALPPGATLTLALSPSVASGVFAALPSLESEPGGDSEETVSSLLPDIAVMRAARRLHVTRGVRPDLADWVSLGLQKLYRYQHPDGGWNWWEFDQTDGDMTSYVLYGLIQARDAGFTVDPQRILRGTDALRRLLAGEQDINRRADWLETFVLVAPQEAEKPLLALTSQQGHLDTYGRASLALGLAHVGSPDATAAAEQIVGELEAKAQEHGRSVSWSAPTGGWIWCDDDVTLSAHVLRALLTVDPHSPLIPGAVQWLMANRDGDAWDTDRAGTEAVLALAQYMEQTQELTPDYTAHVLLDGQTITALNANTETVFGGGISVTLTPSQLAGHTSLVIDKHGAGTLYVSRIVSFTLPRDQATPQSHGITVQRQFRILTDDPSQPNVIASGTNLDVQLSLTADTDYRYVKVEDPIPAGCDVQTYDNSNSGFPIDQSDGDVGYARQEVWDDRVVFYFDLLPRGLTQLTYHLDAVTPGKDTILPGIASLKYFPEVRGNSGLVSVNIGERQP